MSGLDNFAIVALFVRAPIPGQVKTRLAQDLGKHGACELYKAMVADILANLRASGFPMYLFHDGEDSGGLPREWTKASDKIIAQKGENIGARMAAAFEYCFAENVAQVILVGSDIPGLDSRIILEASVALASHDVAITPAVDGGYCLVALKQQSFSPALFGNIPWSTHQVLPITLERCRECSLAVKLLEPLRDIDTIEDLRAYCRKPSKFAKLTNRHLVAGGFLDNEPHAQK